MVTIKYDDLSAAFDFVSFAAPFEHQAFLSLETGEIYWISEAGSIDDEALSDDFETSDRYIAIPHKNDLDLGQRLALLFAERHLTARYASVEACLRRRGAYSRFKELLAAEGCLDTWYEFEAVHTERALRDWCEAKQIQLADSGAKESA